MKHVFGFIILALVFTTACRKEDNTSKNKATVGGEIRNHSEGVLTIEKIQSPHEHLISKTYPVDTLTIDSNWIFVANSTFEEGFYQMVYKDFAFVLYLEPDKTLNINIDANQPESTLEFSGGGKKFNTYLQQVNEERNRLKENAPDLFALPESDFLAAVDASRKRMDTLLVNYITAKPTTNPNVLQLESLNNYYSMLHMLMLYSSQRAYFTEESVALSQRYFDFLNPSSLNDSLAENNLIYYSFLNEALNHFIQEKAQSEKLALVDYADFMQLRIRIIDSVFSSQTIKNYFLGQTALNSIRLAFLNKEDSLLATAINMLSDSVLTEAIHSELELNKHLQAGQKAPHFEVFSPSGKLHQLTDFRGKKLYIDVWATWCAPCLEELPYIKNLQSKSKELNVEVLSITLDENLNTWKKFLKNKAFGGTQCYAENHWNSTFCKDYRIQSIPRYILIDEEGNLISANAPKPSDKKLLDLLK